MHAPPAKVAKSRTEVHVEPPSVLLYNPLLPHEYLRKVNNNERNSFEYDDPMKSDE